MKKKNLLFKCTVTLFTFSLLSGSVFANNFSYKFVEADLFQFDGGGGFGGAIVYPYSPEIYLQAEYATVKSDNKSQENSAIAFGAGFHQPVADKTEGEVFIKYNMHKAKNNRRKKTTKKNSYVFGGSILHKLNDKIDASATLRHRNISKSKTLFSFGVRYHLDKKYSGGFSYTPDDSSSTFSVRMNY